MQTINNERCEISFCKSPAQYVCQRCQKALYCGANHQKLHWRSGHKINCATKEEQKKMAEKIAKQKSDSLIQNKRRYFRKNFVNSYSTSKLQDYLALASILEDAQFTNLDQNNNNNDDVFNYGFTVCLSIKCQYLLGQIPAAKSKMSQYFKNNRLFLSDFKSYLSTNQDKTYYMEKKLQLISILANLSFAIGTQHNQLYVFYCQHISELFGSQSIEMSNAYFLLGCDYAEQGYPIKAIACFNLCSKIRGLESQSCFFNIGILCHWLGRNNDAIHFFNKSHQKRQQNHGQSSNEVAQVYQNLGVVYLNSFDFHTSDYYYSRAMQIRVNMKGEERTSPEYQNLEEAVQNMFKKLCAYIDNDPIQVQKPQTYIALRESMLNNKRYPYSLINKWKKMITKTQKDPIPHTWALQFKQRKQSFVFKADTSKFLKLDEKQIQDLWSQNKEDKDDLNLDNVKMKKHKKKMNTGTEKRIEFSLRISDKIMSLINTTQLIQATELQQRLSYVLNQKKAVQQIQKSEFVYTLSNQQLGIFRKDNEALYSDILQTNPQLMKQQKRASLSAFKQNHKVSFGDFGNSLINQPRLKKQSIIK